MITFVEIIGTLLAAGGFTLLANNYQKLGFIFGLVSCCVLIPMFFYLELYFMLALQSYFAIMNVLGIYNNWRQ